MPPKQHELSFWVGICFTVNYIVGSGFLTLPWAFQLTGLSLAVLVLSVFAFFSVLSTYFLLESMERAIVLLSIDSHKTQQAKLVQPSGSRVAKNYHSEQKTAPDGAGEVIQDAVESSSLLKSPASMYGEFLDLSADTTEVYHEMQSNGRSLRPTSPAHPCSIGADLNGAVSAPEVPETTEHIDAVETVVELCEIFFGPRGRQAYCAIIGVYMYATLWAYTAVFVLAMNSMFPLSLPTNWPLSGMVDFSYYFYLVLFACMVTPLSLMEFSEQAGVQVTMAVFRIVMMVLMVATALASYSSSKQHGGDYSHQFGAIRYFPGDGIPAGEYDLTSISDDYMDDDNAGAAASATLLSKFDPANLPLLLPVAAYAFIFQHSVPALAAPIKDKYSLRAMFTTALLMMLVGYVLVGACVALCFGEETLPSSNLHWRHYLGLIHGHHVSVLLGGNNQTLDFVVPWYAKVVSVFVVVFPAMDVASAFPLNAFTLGNNLMSAYYGDDLSAQGKSPAKKRAFRLLAALPAFLGAACVSDLGKITGFAGLAGFLLAFVVPAALGYFSSCQLEALGISRYTIHSSRFTGDVWHYIVGVVGVVLLLVVGMFHAFS